MKHIRDTILIVDDMEINRMILHGIFEKQYKIIEAENGNQALALIDKEHDNIAAVLLDIVMPEMDGYQVMKELRTHNYLSEFPVIIITVENSTEIQLQAFDFGASELIVKPFEPHVVKRRVQNCIDLNLHKLHQDQIIEEKTQQLRESYNDMVDALSAIIEYRSQETGKHVVRIQQFTKKLLEDIKEKYPESLLDDYTINLIVHASSMHDIGKIAIPDAILNKPGKLTPEEFGIMKAHTTQGSAMLENPNLNKLNNQEFIRYAKEICRSHHERWDGRGYPDSLKGTQIPLSAQVVAVADCYDALTTDRCYRPGFPLDKAYSMIMNGDCGSFAPKLLAAFTDVRTDFEKLAVELKDKISAAPKPQV